MAYIFAMLWVSLFVYLANRQFKKIRNEGLRSDESVSIFGRIGQLYQKVTKTIRSAETSDKDDVKDENKKKIKSPNRNTKRVIAKENIPAGNHREVVIDMILPVDESIKKDDFSSKGKRKSIDGIYWRRRQTTNKYQVQIQQEFDKQDENDEIQVRFLDIKNNAKSTKKVESSAADDDNKKQIQKSNYRIKAIGWILMLIAILPPSLIAGLKSYDVGVDIGYVLDAVHNVQISSNFEDYLNISQFETPNTKGVEKGYLVLVYALSHVISDPHFILFTLEFLTIMFVALFAYKFRDKVNITFVMTVYMLVWYPFTLTMKRQSLAIALIMYSMTFFRNKQYVRTLIVFLFALMMHKSSVIAIGIYILMFISQSRIKTWKKNLFYAICSSMMILGALCFDPLINFFAPIIPDKYVIYLTAYRSVDFESRASDVLPLLVYIIMSVIYLVVMRKRKSKIDMSFILMLLVVDFVFLILNYKIVNLFRLGLYYYYPAVCLLIPSLPLMIKEKRGRSIFILASIIFLLIIWIYKYPIRNQAEIFPYKSEILHISMLERRIDE